MPFKQKWMETSVPLYVVLTPSPAQRNHCALVNLHEKATRSQFTLILYGQPQELPQHFSSFIAVALYSVNDEICKGQFNALSVKEWQESGNIMSHSLLFMLKSYQIEKFLIGLRIQSFSSELILGQGC